MYIAIVFIVITFLPLITAKIIAETWEKTWETQNCGQADERDIIISPQDISHRLDIRLDIDEDNRHHKKLYHNNHKTKEKEKLWF